MARVPLIDPGLHPELAPLVERFMGARRGSLINVYRLLLNSPGLAETWFDHINAVRWKTTLDGRVRELVIIRIGHLNRAAYVIRQHVPKLALADGVSEAECAALEDWRPSTLFSAKERATLAYVDAVTVEARAADDVFAAMSAHYDDRAIVELTVLIATYNMHTRVMNALSLDLETQ